MCGSSSDLALGADGFPYLDHKTFAHLSSLTLSMASLLFVLCCLSAATGPLHR